eukprot:TRINITY_DN9047_c0_g1_i7.p1 TRINITY_DN9047_c0_g1~~TRINITY_DN9047_c0_g1_i7.p1  ORF type:complete len:312 (-),score=82.46 TRINITY_DN9047_c0_g1_i7:286-1221(-)
MSTTAADDRLYTEQVLRFVVNWYNADSSRIYFTGQSAGGMASIQFAVPSGAGSLPWDLQPAAIAAASAGGARNSAATLQGQVPALLMWGYLDTTAPTTIWHGTTRDLRSLPSSPQFAQLAREHGLLAEAARIVENATSSLSCDFDCSPKIANATCCLLLKANTMTGGEFLAKTAQEKKLQASHEIGCPDDGGGFSSISRPGFMWQNIKTMLSQMVYPPGRMVNMSELSWRAASAEEVPAEAQKAVDLICAETPGAAARVRVCLHNGKHSYPWLNSGRCGNDFQAAAGPDGHVFHDFVWNFFGRGQLVRRRR